MTDPVGIGYIRTLVEGAREYVRHTAVRRSDQLTTHHHGEADHLAWLDRPFAEARRGDLMFYGSGHVEINTVWYHQTFGAHDWGQRVGWTTWGPWWYPTAAYRVW